MPIELREETFYTAHEVAEMLKVDIRTVRRMLKDGRLTASRLGSRIYVTDSAMMEALSNPANVNKPRLSPEGRERMRQVAAKAFAGLQAKRAAKRAQAEAEKE